MRRHAFLAFENAVEVSHVVESAAVSDLGDGHIGVYQHARHVPQADLGQRIDEALPGDFLDETAECHVGHADHGRDFGEGDLPVEFWFI